MTGYGTSDYRGYRITDVRQTANLGVRSSNLFWRAIFPFSFNV